MGFESPRCSGSSRTFSSLLSPRPHTNITANAGKDYIGNAAVAGSNPACPARGSSSVWLEHRPLGAVLPNPRRRGRREPWRMPDGLHGLSRPRCGFDSRRAGQSARSSTEEQGCPSNKLVAMTKSKLANAGGTTGQSARSDAGGRRSNSASGKPDSSGRCLAIDRRRHRTNETLANAGGTTWVRPKGRGGSTPPPGSPGMSRQSSSPAP